MAYGLERIAMYLQGVDNLFDLTWTDGPLGRVTYRDVFHQSERELSAYNFEHADVDALFAQFEVCERECDKLAGEGLSFPAYEQVLRASHTFNLLDARHAISVTERQRYILRVRALAPRRRRVLLRLARGAGLSAGRERGGVTPRMDEGCQATDTHSTNRSYATLSSSTRPRPTDRRAFSTWWIWERWSGFRSLRMAPSLTPRRAARATLVMPWARTAEYRASLAATIDGTATSS